MSGNKARLEIISTVMKARLVQLIKSKSGRTTTRSVVRRLQDAGFHRIKPWPQAFGVVAYKS